MDHGTLRPVTVDVRTATALTSIPESDIRTAISRDELRASINRGRLYITETDLNAWVATLPLAGGVE